MSWLISIEQSKEYFQVKLFNLICLCIAYQRLDNNNYQYVEKFSHLFSIGRFAINIELMLGRGHAIKKEENDTEG